MIYARAYYLEWGSMAFKAIWILEGTYVVPKMLLSFIYQMTKEKSEFDWDLEQKRLW